MRSKTKKWSRRAFLETTLVGGGAIATLTIPVFGCRLQTDVQTAELDSIHRATLHCAMDDIIPAALDRPSATEAGALDYVLELLDEDPHLLREFESGVDRLNEISRSQFAGDFPQLRTQERVKVLTRLEREASPEFFGRLRDYTYEAYYTRSRVWQVIGYEPYPTNAPGPQMSPFDEQLLDRVRRSPRLYK